MAANLNINQTNSANRLSIDTSAVSKVTSEIINRAQTKSAVQTPAITRTQRGIDFYNPQTSIGLQRELTSANAGLNINTINTGVLNAIAATNAYSSLNAANKVQCKMTIAIPEGELQIVKEVSELPRSVEVFSTAELSRDKRGSNPFAGYQTLKEQDEKQEIDILG